MTLVGNDDAWIRYKFFPEFDELASWNKNVKDIVIFDFHISNIEMIEIIIIAIFNYRGYFQYFPTNVLVSGITIIYYQLSKNINFVCESIEVKNRIWIFPILSNLVSSKFIWKRNITSFLRRIEWETEIRRLTQAFQSRIRRWTRKSRVN